MSITAHAEKGARDFDFWMGRTWDTNWVMEFTPAGDTP
jgi:hypothetical protein